MSQAVVIDTRPSGPSVSERKRAAEMLASLLAKGETHLENNQFASALDCFEMALCFDSKNQQAQQGVNRAHCQVVPRWHFEMLNDEKRNAAFERALINAITPETIVLDIGSGTGLLAMMAARAGAKETVTCEMVPQLAELARDTVAANGLADRIITLDKKSTALVIGYQMVHKANLLVTETVDCGLLGEGIVSSIAHAKANLLTEDAQIVPCAATVYAIVVESPRLRNLNRAQTAAGFDVSLVNRYATANYTPVRLGAFEYTPLTEPFPVFSFDFVNGAIAPERRQIEVKVQSDGTAQCVIFWFHMQLDAENAISNEPGSTTHWEQALQGLGTEVAVRAGQKLVIDVEHDCHLIRFKGCEATA